MRVLMSLIASTTSLVGRMSSLFQCCCRSDLASVEDREKTKAKVLGLICSSRVIVAPLARRQAAR